MFIQENDEKRKAFLGFSNAVAGNSLLERFTRYFMLLIDSECASKSVFVSVVNCYIQIR